MSRFILDPTRPWINPHDKYVDNYMCCHYPSTFFWDHYVIFDDNITIFYHTYEPDNLDYYPHRPFYIKRIDEQITITLNELINFRYENNKGNI